MSDSPRPKQIIGEVVWRDLTVPNAGALCDFYRAVVGWEAVDHPMPAPPGGEPYSDFVMQSPEGTGEGEAFAGICHALGSNANLPPAWLVYVRVADIEASAAEAVARGGELLDGPREMGNGVLAVVRDPAGAVLGLWAD